MTLNVEQAQSRLPELIDHLGAGQEVLITRDGHPVAKLVGQASPTRQWRQPGWAKNIITHIADDFDAPLDDFREYQ